MSKRNRRKVYAVVRQDGINQYLLEFEQVWQWLKSKNRWLGMPGLKGIVAWYITFFHRMYVVLAGSKPIQDKYGFGIPNENALNRLAQLGKLIEIGAGLGYWAGLLRQRGVDIVAFDKFNVPGEEGSWFSSESKNWTEVLRGDTSVLREYAARVLFLCYPSSNNSMASEALAAYSGNTFAYVATSQANAVGDLRFHRQLDSHWELVEAIPIPGWLDFSYRFRQQVRFPLSWRQVSLPRVDSPLLYIPPANYGNNLFIFRRRVDPR